jgi:hypothetical protein
MEPGAKVGGWRRRLFPQWLRCSVACVLTVAAVAVVTLAAVGFSGESPVSAAGAPGTWQVEQTYTPTPGDLSAISCATTSDCMAVESGYVVVTTNGGTNWTTENAPAGIGQINAISCPSATTCTVVGYGAPTNLPVLATTTNGGMSWTDQSLPPGLIQLLGISCPSTTTCSAVGAWNGSAAPSAEETAAVVTTTNGGASWTSESVPADSEDLLGISCPSTTTCVAVGAVPYPAVSCRPFPNCPVNLSFVMFTTNGGTTWSGETGSSPGADEGDSFQGVSCPTTSECVAVGSTNNPDGGQVGVAEGILLSGACTLVTGCGTLSVPASSGYLGSVSCFSASTCIAVGGALIATAGATGWTTENTSLQALSGVTCPSPSECLVSGGVAEDGQPGAVAESTNGGASWAAVFTFAYAVSSLFAVSCPSPSVCSAVGGSTGPGEASGDFGPGEGPGVVLNSTDGGAGWTKQTLPAGTGPVSSVSCASTSVCEALGSYPAPFIIGTTDGGTTWQSQTAPSGLTYLNSIACPSAMVCTAVGQTGGPTPNAVIFGTTDGGSTWTTQAAPIGLSDLTSIACPSAMVCTAVGQTNASEPTPNAAIVATTNGGAMWTTETPPSQTFDLTSVACPTLSACMAIGRATPDPTPLTIISTTNGGATWTTASSFPSSEIAIASDIACASVTVCMVVGEASAGGSGGVALATADGGSTWTTESTPAASDYSGISCPAIGACTAVGEVTGASTTGGAIIIGQAPPITTVALPSNGARVSSDIWLDASASPGATAVQYELTGGGLTDLVIDSAAPTIVGWLGAWDTTRVPNGPYTLQSVASYPGGISVTSLGISVTVYNLPLHTQVLVPSNGATLGGSAAVLDASAAGTSDVSGVQFVVSGESLSDQVVGTAMQTIYGWIAFWNTTTIANGSYTVQSVATETGGTIAMSPPIDVTVDNGGT